MHVDPNLANQIEVVSFLVLLVGLLWNIFRAASWLRGLKDDITNDVGVQLARQTNAIVAELREIRQDFRVAMAPPPRLVRARSSKKKVDSVLETHV